MKIKSFLSILTALLCFVSFSNAQQRGFCGTENFETHTNRLLRNQQLIKQGVVNLRNAIRYVPVKYHIVGENDGTGRVSLKKVLEQHAAINRDYGDTNLQFYIDGDLNYIDNSTIYISQSSLFALSEMEKQRGAKALNVFFVKEAKSSNNSPGVILGYHQTFRDWLVIRNDQVNERTGTLSHEIGHFFSLLHTHNGWDGFQWDHSNPDPIQVANTSPNNVATEKQDGSNCQSAGDFICDTPPDYNFGFGWFKDNSTCAPYDAGVKDPTGTLVDPMENNFMGYFINCSDYLFTAEQAEVMDADYNSSQRAYIRTGFTPNLNEITVKPNLIGPIDNEVTDGFNRVDFDWAGVDNANRYLLEVDRLPDFSFGPKTVIVSATSASLENFEADKFYFWRVTPLNEYTTDALPSSTERFKAGSATVSADYIEGVNNWYVYPNPLQSEQELTIFLNTGKAFTTDIKIYNLSGMLINTIERYQFGVGESSLQLSTSGLTRGLYIVSLQTEEAIVNRKLVVK